MCLSVTLHRCQRAGRVLEVTQDNEDEPVSPRFRLKQFVCKQQAGSRKYVVLNERLLLALEHGLERVNGDGVMDDLNGDGLRNIRDAEVLYRLSEDAAARPEAQGLIGGLSKYPSMAAHGPFVHVDVREGKARW